MAAAMNTWNETRLSVPLRLNTCVVDEKDATLRRLELNYYLSDGVSSGVSAQEPHVLDVNKRCTHIRSLYKYDSCGRHFQYAYRQQSLVDLLGLVHLLQRLCRIRLACYIYTTPPRNGQHMRKREGGC